MFCMAVVQKSLSRWTSIQPQWPYLCPVTAKLAKFSFICGQLACIISTLWPMFFLVCLQYLSVLQVLHILNVMWWLGPQLGFHILHMLTATAVHPVASFKLAYSFTHHMHRKKATNNLWPYGMLLENAVSQTTCASWISLHFLHSKHTKPQYNSYRLHFCSEHKYVNTKVIPLSSAKMWKFAHFDLRCTCTYAKDLKGKNQTWGGSM